MACAAFWTKFLQSIRRGVQPFEKEREHGRVSRRELSRMQIPALIETADERMPHLVGVQLPRSVDRGRIRGALRCRQRRARRCTVRSDRHDVGRAVGQPHAAWHRASDTCITCFAKSHDGCSMPWWAAVMPIEAV